MTKFSQRKRDRRSCRKRAEELVSQMTLEEKAGQMLHEAPAIPRLGIPSYNWWGEALHGVARAGTATVFPQAIGMAASFDPELLRQIADVVSDEGRAKFNSQFRHGDTDIYKGLTFWSPNVNIFRDPRWGRGHETYGEDPYLSGLLGVAYIEGLQGDDPDYLKIAACAKHFAVHSGPEDVRHSFNAEVSDKDLYETYLPAFKACVQEGGVESVMGAYNRVNGEAACASPRLLQKILRDEWGFEGHVVSDCWAIKDIFREKGGHGLARRPADGVAMAIEAGCDLNCGHCYGHAVDAVIENILDEDLVTEACVRLFTTRMLLGLFDKSPYDDISYLENDSKAHARFNHEVSRHFPVLLKNDGLLPLDKKQIKTLGIIGPNANNRKALVGNYEGTASRHVTISEGLQDYLADTDARILFSEGCHLYKERLSNIAQYDNDRISEVKEICEQSDLIVACFGLDPGLEGEEGDQGNQFASGDKPNILFPGIQREVLNTIYSYGKPVILLVLSGSCLALDEDMEQASAIMQCWYPGALGGLAVADLLFGEASPQGKLPLTFYSEHYELPEFTDYSMKNRTYRYHRGQVCYPFGFGLTYGDFVLDEAEVSAYTIGKDGVDIKVKVTNRGSREAEETLQVYVKAKGHDPLYPQLKAVAKCPLGPSVTGEYRLHLPEDAFEAVREDGSSFIPEGEFELYVGFSQPDEQSIKLMGQSPRVFTLRR